MFSVVLLSQSTVSSSRAAKPSVPFEGWYRGQEVGMWSTVCSSAASAVYRGQPRSWSPLSRAIRKGIKWV